MAPVSDVDPAADLLAAPAPKRSPPRWLDLAVRVVGFGVAVALAGVSAMFEAFLSALYWGTVRFPLALVVAVLGNLVLVWFAYTVTGRRLAVLGPALAWTAVMVTASTRTNEGDLVLTSNNWVGIGTMIAGTVAFAIGAYRLILAGGRPPRSAPAPPE